MSDKLRFSPLTWYRKSLQGMKPPFPGQSVPCGSCSACCSARVVLYPPIDDPATYGTVTEADGTITLSRHADGRCLYLHDGKCLIYARRPLTCRTFDCRALLVADVPQPAHIYAAASEKFEMVFKAPGDRIFAADAQKTARLAHAKGKTPEQQIQDALYQSAMLQ